MQRTLADNTSCELSNKEYGFIIHADKHYQSGLRCEFFITPPPLRVLSFKGGISRTFVYRAVLDYLENTGILSHIQEIGGSSSGCNAAIFGCIPFETSSDRIKAMDTVADTYAWDIMGNTSGWRIYKTLTTPLNVVSGAIGWIGKGINNLTNEYRSTFPERMAGYPLKLLSMIFNTAAFATSPNTYAGLYNLVTAGGIYHADLVQAAFREQIQLSVQAGLEDLLDKKINKYFYIEQLVNIGLCTYIDGKLQVIPDITFHHLAELAKIPGSQFKEGYLTSTRVKDKALRVYNKETTPNMPLHMACRLVITFPLLFTNKSYLGEEYFDGGIKNNAPVDLATDKKLSDLYESLGVTDKLARLNIRVEYPEEYQYHLWRKQPDQTFAEKVNEFIQQSVGYLLTRGEDSYANDAKVTKNMQDNYAQRTLQLKDFGISKLGSELTKEMRDDLCNQLMPDIDEYFTNHVNEKIIMNYEISEKGVCGMPVEVQAELLKFLQDTENKTEEIFDVSGEKEDLELLRDKLSLFLSKLVSVEVDNQLENDACTSTGVIHKNIGVTCDNTRVQNEEYYDENDKYTEDKDNQILTELTQPSDLCLEMRPKMV